MSAAKADMVSSYFDTMLEKEAERLEGIDSLLLVEETMGLTRVEYYEKVSSVELDSGDTVYLRNVPPHEIQQRHAGGNDLGSASPAELRNAADEIERQGPEVERALEEEMSKSGFPPGLASLFMNAGDDPRTPGHDAPWLSPNPRSMAGMYATMLRAAAKGKEDVAAREASEASARSQREEALAAMQYVGSMTMNGRPAEQFAATDLGISQQADGTTVTFDRVEFFGDAERHVPLLLRIEGEASDGRETRPVTIERADMDYRTVPGCGDFYQPYKSVMRISGTMTAEEEAQMAEAAAQLAEFEKQLAAMPAGQRDMIMRQMGPQMEMMRNMSSGGGIEVVSNVTTVRCNVPPPTPLEMAQGTFAPMSMAGGGSDVRPFYVDEQGIGVLRYSGREGEYFLEIRRAAGGREQVLVGGMGPYRGPDIGVYPGSLKMMQVPLESLELELYQENPRRTVAVYRPEVDPGRAESRSDCGEVAPNGACSR